MLYTNRGLEIIKKGDDRILEILDMYGNRLEEIYIDKKVSNQLISVQGKLHENLSLKVDNNKITLVNEKDDNIYVILDLLDYKCFQRNSVLLKLKGDTGFDTIKYFRTSNRCDRCKWGLHILKAPKREFSILKMYSTSGSEKYLTIYKTFIMLHSKESLLKYINNYNIDFKLDESDEAWELLKRNK